MLDLLFPPVVRQDAVEAVRPVERPAAITIDADALANVLARLLAMLAPRAPAPIDEDWYSPGCLGGRPRAGRWR